MDDLLGEFVGTRGSKRYLDAPQAPVAPHAAGSLLDNSGLFSEGIVTQEDDDFGDFQDPETSLKALDDHSITASKAKAGHQNDGDFLGTKGGDILGATAVFPITSNQQFRCPQPDTIMNHISDNILTLPESFFSELSLIPYTLRRRVLSDARTKLWIKGVVEGGQIGQRIIRGRKRKTKGASTQDKLSVDVAAQKLSSLWSSIIPRLTSLSTGSLKLKPMTLRSFNEDFVEAESCEVCATEDDEVAPFLQIDGLRGHQTCIALMKHMQTTQCT